MFVNFLKSNTIMGGEKIQDLDWKSNIIQAVSNSIISQGTSDISSPLKLNFLIFNGYILCYLGLRSVQLLSHVWLFATPWTAVCQASLFITSSWNLLKLMSIESVMPSNHLTLCRPLILLPSIFPSIKVFSNEPALPISCPKHWRFSISPSSEYSGLISFRIDWFDLLAVQGTLNSLVLSFLYSPALTSIHDHWRNHSLD